MLANTDRRIEICWVVRPIGRLPLFTDWACLTERKTTNRRAANLGELAGSKLNCWVSCCSRRYLLLTSRFRR